MIIYWCESGGQGAIARKTPNVAPAALRSILFFVLVYISALVMRVCKFLRCLVERVAAQTLRAAFVFFALCAQEHAPSLPDGITIEAAQRVLTPLHSRSAASSLKERPHTLATSQQASPLRATLARATLSA